MSKVSFSPTEEAVLTLIGNRYWTMQELKEELYPDIPPEAVAAAVSYLRRNHLLSAHGDGFLQTSLGVQLLAEYRRSKCQHVIALAQETVA